MAKHLFNVSRLYHVVRKEVGAEDRQDVMLSSFMYPGMTQLLRCYPVDMSGFSLRWNYTSLLAQAGWDDLRRSARRAPSGNFWASSAMVLHASCAIGCNGCLHTRARAAVDVDLRIYVARMSARSTKEWLHAQRHCAGLGLEAVSDDGEEEEDDEDS